LFSFNNLCLFKNKSDSELGKKKSTDKHPAYAPNPKPTSTPLRVAIWNIFLSLKSAKGKKVSYSG
jgi:hypothetical protein